MMPLSRWKRPPFDLIGRPSYALGIPYRSGFSVTAVTVSEKYQIIGVPREAWAALGMRPGQSLRVLVYRRTRGTYPQAGYPREARLPRAS